MNNRNKIIVSLIILLVIASSFYLYSKNKTEDITVGWAIFNDSTKGISFKYPAEINAKYITTAEWPPQTNIVSGEMTCTESGDETIPTGKTSEQTIDGNKYCTNTVSEGAAGSTYTSYAYARKVDAKIVILAFRLRFVQCANYEDSKKTECESERTAFDINPIIGGIFDTVKLSTPK